MMQMKNRLFAMGAALAAVMGASPASATIYTYNLVGAVGPIVETAVGTVSINTVTQQGRVVYKSTRSDLDFVFNSADFVNFSANSPQNFISLVTSSSGKFIIDSVQRNISNYDFNTKLTSANFSQQNGNYKFNYTISGLGGINYAFTMDPSQFVEVPEPAMLGLFGAGAVMVMVGRRRRDRFGKAGTGQLALAC